MDKEKIYKRLLEIAKKGENTWQGPFLLCDSVDQEELFQIQEMILDLLDEIDRETTFREFPRLYETK